MILHFTHPQLPRKSHFPVPSNWQTDPTAFKKIKKSQEEIILQEEFKEFSLNIQVLNGKNESISQCEECIASNSHKLSPASRTGFVLVRSSHLFIENRRLSIPVMFFCCPSHQETCQKLTLDLQLNSIQEENPPHTKFASHVPLHFKKHWRKKTAGSGSAKNSSPETQEDSVGSPVAESPKNGANGPNAMWDSIKISPEPSPIPNPSEDPKMPSPPHSTSAIAGLASLSQMIPSDILPDSAAMALQAMRYIPEPPRMLPTASQGAYIPDTTICFDALTSAASPIKLPPIHLSPIMRGCTLPPVRNLDQIPARSHDMPQFGGVKRTSGLLETDPFGFFHPKKRKLMEISNAKIIGSEKEIDFETLAHTRANPRALPDLSAARYKSHSIDSVPFYPRQSQPQYSPHHAQSENMRHGQYPERFYPSLLSRSVPHHPSGLPPIDLYPVAPSINHQMYNSRPF
eukprot:TRINITY_DN1590_c0_g1_i2.p1 TRINITY_DN1590_c0_g1~~TRINITY_DN1590_c0_g1_i2.p1  ORF type:complete len:505 (-),score=131.56 TRINITY_DN1590_c0_g1_i2:509-1882(-)